MKLIHNRYKLVIDSEVLEDIMEFTAMYGDIIFEELYHALDREPTQYEYDNEVDRVFYYFIDLALSHEVIL